MDRPTDQPTDRWTNRRTHPLIESWLTTKNLSDLIVNAKEKANKGSSGLCGKSCKLCKFMVDAEEVTDKRVIARQIKGERKMQIG